MVAGISSNPIDEISLSPFLFLGLAKPSMISTGG
jgi:hypothetical protein